MEKTESILTLTNLLMGAGGTGGLGFLFKFFYNSIKDGFDSIRLSSKKQFDEIKQDLVSQKTDITNLSDKFTNFNLIIQKIDITLTSVEKDLDKANENLSKTNSLAVKNEKLISDNRHDIKSLKGNLEGFTEIVKEYDDKIIELSKKVFCFRTGKKMNLSTTRNIELIVVHCADTYARMDIGAKEIKQWHTSAPRYWSDIAYHFIIRRDGTLELGRPLDRMGAHCKGYNKDSIGICYVGGKGDNHKPEDNRTNAQKKTLSALIISLQAEYPNVKVKGHNELSNKNCPSYDVQKDMHSLLDYLFML